MAAEKRFATRDKASRQGKKGGEEGQRERAKVGERESFLKTQEVSGRERGAKIAAEISCFIFDVKWVNKILRWLTTFLLLLPFLATHSFLLV